MSSSRKRSQDLFQRLVESDHRIKQIRSSFRTKKRRRDLIRQVVEERREGTTRKQRLFARLGGFDQIARARTLSSIKKSGKGFSAKIGGRVKGKVFKFSSRNAAVRAVNSHHDNFLKSRLGKKEFLRVKKAFSVR